MFFSPASDLDLGAQATLLKARTQSYMILCPIANECLCREATKASINVPCPIRGATRKSASCRLQVVGRIEYCYAGSHRVAVTQSILQLITFAKASHTKGWSLIPNVSKKWQIKAQE